MFTLSGREGRQGCGCSACGVFTVCGGTSFLGLISIYRPVKAVPEVKFMLRTTLLASVAISPLLLANASAQEAYDLGEIIVSGSLSPVTEGQTGATVEVLTEADLGTSDTSVIQRLDRLPGVSSSSNGGVGSATSIRIRGLGPSYVGVRLDGIDITDPASLTPQFNFGGLLSSGLARVEVLKGSQSALYGSEAIAGVVNMTSFTPEKAGFSGKSTFETGSFGTNTASVSTGYKTERGFVALTYGHFTTDGFSARTQDGDDPAVTEDDGFRQSTINARGEYALTDALSVGVALFHRSGDLDYDIGSKDAAGDITSEERGARVYAKLRTGIIANTFSYSYFDVDRDVQLRRFELNPELQGELYVVTYRGTRKNLSYLGTAEISSAMVLNFGADYTEEEYRSNGIFASEDNTSINTELLFSPSSQIDLSAALRYDDNSTFGGKTTGRLAGVWRPREDLAFRGVIGTGFRAPSLNERFGPFGANPDLNPEESISYEIGIEKTFVNGFIKATIFQSDIDNIIDYDWQSESACNCYTQIPGTSRSKGIEISGEYALAHNVNLFGNYTYTDAKDEEGARLGRVPRHDLVLGANADLSDRFGASLDMRFVGDVVPTPKMASASKVGTYTVVGAGLTFDLSDTAQAYLRVENLFDEDYQTAIGYNTPGRSAYIGLRADF